MPKPPDPAHQLCVDGTIQLMRSRDEAAAFARRRAMGAHAGPFLDPIAGASNPLPTGRVRVAVATSAEAMQRSGRVTLAHRT